MTAGVRASCGVLMLLRADAREVVASHAAVARSAIDRAVGLLKYRAMPQEMALIFPECSSVHTVGMRFAIDLIFINRAWRVVRAEPKVGPGRLIFPVRDAWAVVEVAAGTIRRLGLAVGDVLGLLPQSVVGKPVGKP